MHELAVTQSILEISLRHAKEAGASQVTCINLVIGEFASIVDDSVQFYWELLAEGTIAKNAKLHFERIAGEMTCTNCKYSFHPTDRNFSCPNCASEFVQITKGDEFRVDSIDVE
jgi:hydrogenase nickel incorporation protein HypA/HybF